MTSRFRMFTPPRPKRLKPRRFENYKVNLLESHVLVEACPACQVTSESRDNLLPRYLRYVALSIGPVNFV